MSEKRHRAEGLSGFDLKLLMCLSMLFDHSGAVLFPKVTWLRILGRFAFPIACFLMSEGFYYPSSRSKYLKRLFLFALISEIPFDLAFHQTIYYPQSQNVFFTLFLGLAMLTLMDGEESLFLRVLIVGSFCSVASILQTDYGACGLLILLACHRFKGNQKILVCVFFFLNTVLLTRAVPLLAWGFAQYEKGRTVLEILQSSVLKKYFFHIHTQDYAILSFLLFHFYHGKEGKKCKGWFYLFYPLHLLGIFML